MSAFPTRFLLSAPTFRSSRKIVRMMHARFLVRCVQCIDDNARPRSGSRLVVVRLFPRSREDESNLIIYTVTSRFVDFREVALKLNIDYGDLEIGRSWIFVRDFFSTSIKRTCDKGSLPYRSISLFFPSLTQFCSSGKSIFRFDFNWKWSIVQAEDIFVAFIASSGLSSRYLYSFIPFLFS